MTPWRSGRWAEIVAGVRPIIRRASSPTACTSLVRSSIATTEGSETTMPLPWTNTSVLAVPRSMAMSRPRKLFWRQKATPTPYSARAGVALGLRQPGTVGAVIALDHVILGAPDVDALAERLESRHRLPSQPGGRHAGLGTENRIVALGDAYLELMGVADHDEAAGNWFGNWVLERVAGGVAFLGWCVRTDDLDSVCARLELEPQPMSRTRPDGVELRWRLAGLDRATVDPSLPFFIQWEVPDDQLPGRIGTAAQAADARVAAVEVGADEAALREWLGEDLGEVRLVDGPPGVQSVTVAGAGGTEVVRAGGAG